MPEGIQIFLMEDDADDIELLEGSLKANKVRCRMDVVMEGDKVQDYIIASSSRSLALFLQSNSKSRASAGT